MTDQALAAFDAAIAAELPRVSHLSCDSHEMCKHFAAQVRARLAAHPTEPANHIERNLDMVEPVAAHGTQSTLHNAACDVPGLRNVPAQRAALVGLTDDEVMGCMHADMPEFTRLINEAFAQINNLPLRDGGERGN